MMGDWHWDGGGFGWVGLLFMLLFIAIIIVGIVLVVRSLSDQGRERGGGGYGAEERNLPRRSAALDVLEERYARGEITREEFLDRRKDLTG